MQLDTAFTPFTPSCDPGAERFPAFAELTVDISAVLPYLNATLRGAIYHRSANALTWAQMLMPRRRFVEQITQRSCGVDTWCFDLDGICEWRNHFASKAQSVRRSN
jgi:hypothetical protein